MTKLEADRFAVEFLAAFDISTDHCKRATLHLEAGQEPVIEVVYSLSHVPVFDKLGELKKHYKIEDISKEYYDDS